MNGDVIIIMFSLVGQHENFGSGGAGLSDETPPIWVMATVFSGGHDSKLEVDNLNCRTYGGG